MTRARKASLGVMALLAAALGGCTRNTGVDTTESFTPAQYVVTQKQPKGIRPARQFQPRWGVIEPPREARNGGQWVIDDAGDGGTYHLYLNPDAATPIALPPGEKFNGATGGRVNDFVVAQHYAGPRAVVSVTPKNLRSRSNMNIMTSVGLYQFKLTATRGPGIPAVELNRRGGLLDGAPIASDVPPPGAGFTRLSVKPTDERVGLPAWAPTEAWADKDRAVIRFNAPLPQLPALFAGRNGEQAVTYQRLEDGAGIYLVTNRRVTKAMLRLDDEEVMLADALNAPHSAAEARTAAALPEASPAAAAPIVQFFAPGAPPATTTEGRSLDIGITTPQPGGTAVPSRPDKKLEWM